MYVVLTLLCLLPLAVGGRVLWVVLTDRAELQERGARQAQSRVDIPAMRGAILDRSGRALAINTARYDLALDPTIDGFSEQEDAFFEKLSTLTGRSARYFRRKVARRASPQYVRLLRNLPEEQAETIESWDMPWLILTPKFARRYNYGTTAAHVLGHVNADGEGLAGLELKYDEHLTGTPGWRAVKRNRRGQIRAMVGGKVVTPKHGQNLRLTIDLVRQTVLEDELQRGLEESGAAWGTAIAMDPHTGAILALANAPTYDPNRTARYSDFARRNRAITDRIEPGSTFKLVGAAAAVEQDVTEMTDSVETGDGWAVFHGRTMQDTHAYGTIPFSEVIVHSSNVGMAKTVRQMEPGTFYQYARNFGFGQSTWVDLPGEVAGVLKKPSAWSGTSLTSMAIGYEVAATPLQVLTAYAALANGGVLVQPHVVHARQSMRGETQWQYEPDSIRRAIQRRTAETLKPAFRQVVTQGTAEAAFVDGLDIAGKTGTALKASGGSYQPDAARASFVGFFPAEEPAVAMIVVLGNPQTSIYGGAVAAPIFRRIARRWASTFPQVTNYVAETRAEAQQQPQQQPSASETAPVAAASLAERAQAAAGAMPDLTGLGARDAMAWLADRDIDVKVRGHGTIVDQWPAAGETLATRAVLRCEP